MCYHKGVTAMGKIKITLETYRDLILQTDPRLPEYLGYWRWYCYCMACLAIPQILTGVIFDVREHREIYDKFMRLGLLTIESVENNVIKPFIPDTAALITAALKQVQWIGRAVHIGNANEYLSYATPHRTDFTLIRRLSVKRNDNGGFKVKGHHFVLGNENAIEMWNSHPGLDLEPDPHFIRIRIDGR